MTSEFFFMIANDIFRLKVRKKKKKTEKSMNVESLIHKHPLPESRTYVTFKCSVSVNKVDIDVLRVVAAAFMSCSEGRRG